MAQPAVNHNRYVPFRVREEDGVSYPSNYIRTTKYSLLTFLPLNLFEQFLKKANFYFLVIAVLSTTEFSPKTPLVSIVPLVFVLGVTAVKEGLEDYRRYQEDKEVNSKKVLAYRDGAWGTVQWAELRVGDMVKVVDGGSFPADILILQSSSRSGVCSIETSNLDGETNLKVKQAVEATYSIQCNEQGTDYPRRFRAVVEGSPPNEKMDRNSWKGNLLGLNGSSGRVPLGMAQLCLRGCSMRNTKWIVGLVLFTGVETKLAMQRKKGAKIKRSRVDRIVDKALYVIFALDAALCIFGAVFYSYWMHQEAFDHWYLPFVIDDIDIDREAGLAFFTYIILLDLMVPISLYVSMELVKFAQAWFINQDLDMYYAVNDIPARARTSNLNEELGQVSFVFSDKTGTLTRNEMEFLRCSVAGVSYGPGDMAASGEPAERLPPRRGVPDFAEQYRFEDNRMLHNLVNRTATARDVDHFLTNLAVCHTVIPEYTAEQEEDLAARGKYAGVEPRYQAASPDELALVLAAKEQQYFFMQREPCKFMFRGREINGYRSRVNILGQVYNFDVLEILEFNSTRKRMSVVCLDPRDKKIKIFCKGADNVIRERCDRASMQAHWKRTERHLRRFAAEGLRTLVCAYRVVPGEEFDEWFDAHQQAKGSMQNRDGEVTASAARIEHDFTLLGATAIEDRLQDGVPEAIEKMAQAGARIWVLTGDKVETAINIGRSCRLLTPKMRGDNLVVIDPDEGLDDKTAKKQTLEALKGAADLLKDLTEDERENVGLVINGKALGYVFPARRLDANRREIVPPPVVLEEEAALQVKYYGICSAVKAVVCCRMSPKQKAQVVRLVRSQCDDITLAIGDGANDVAMIEAAHVGIGIEGLEGKQAVMASDYSLGQFRFLTRLLLVHGAWSYRRLSVLILYSFYKNIVVTMCNILFAVYSGYAGSIFYDAISGALFNMMFTAFPVLFAAAFNRDYSKKSAMRYPQLYESGPENEHFNIRRLLNSLALGTLHSGVLFTSAVFIFGLTTTREDGQDNDQWVAATAFFTSAVILVNAVIALKTTTWFRAHFYAVGGSVLAWFLWAMAYSATDLLDPDMFWVFFRLLADDNFRMYIFVAPAACLFPMLAHEFLRLTFWFTRADIIREREAGYIGSPDLEGLPADPDSDGAAAAKARAERKAAREAKLAAKRAAGGAAGDEELDRLIADTSVSERTLRRLALAHADHLGYVPFLEDETGDGYVMGQNEFLRKYLMARSKRKTYNIPEKPAELERFLAEQRLDGAGGAAAAASSDDDEEEDDDDMIIN